MAKGAFDFSTPPLVFAGWPGMGDVGLKAMEYIRQKVDAHLFAELDMSPFYTPEEVVVEGGLARFPEIPKSLFLEHHNPDVVIFESTMQLGGADAMTVTQAVLDVVHKTKAKRVFTAAAFPFPMSYKSEPRVFFAANNKKLINKLTLQGVEPMPEGFISGPNGILLGIAASQKIEAACIMATIPSYATGLPYPKASLAIVKTLADIANLDIPTEDLQAEADSYDENYEEIEERLRQVFPNMIEGEDEMIPGAFPEPTPSEEKEDKVPEFVMKKIEHLFREVAKSKNKDQASELKQELDKWGIFDLYEKRFLDLFKEE
ncbi:ATP-grasp family protein [Chitinispirillum alkaliphilum]|nr:ATP-grasp family protein [Chitinispirillum alkaliphilum]